VALVVDRTGCRLNQSPGLFILEGALDRLTNKGASPARSGNFVDHCDKRVRKLYVQSHV